MEPLDRPAPRVPAEIDDAAADGPADPSRAARLEAICEQVAAGTYDTSERFDAALDGLLADLLD